MSTKWRTLSRSPFVDAPSFRFHYSPNSRIVAKVDERWRSAVGWTAVH
jgi:hypothetical protein